MRCTCPDCGTFMPQAERGAPRCICPGCGYSCTACMGTPGLISAEELSVKLYESSLFQRYFTPVKKEKDT